MSTPERQLVQLPNGTWVVQDTHTVFSYLPSYVADKLSPVTSHVPTYAWTIDLVDNRNHEWQPRDRYSNAYIQLRSVADAEGQILSADEWELAIWCYAPLAGFDDIDILPHLLDLDNPTVIVPISLNQFTLIQDIARSAARKASMATTYASALAHTSYRLDDIRISPFGNIDFQVHSIRRNTKTKLTIDLEHNSLTITDENRGSRSLPLPGPWPTRLDSKKDINAFVHSPKWHDNLFLTAILDQI